MPALASRTLNPLTGIIPQYPEGYGSIASHQDCRFMFSIPAPVDHYAPIVKGSQTKNRVYPKRGPQIPAVGSLIGVHKATVPTYSGIELQNQMHDPDNYDIIHTMEITPGMDVLLNGVLIATAPENKQMRTGKNKKFSQIERARFCRGVIWWIMNDPTCLKDKLAEIGYGAPINKPAPVNQDAPVNAVKQYPFPVKIYPEGWINHLRLSITEVPA